MTSSYGFDLLLLLVGEELDELGARRVVPDQVRVLGVAVEDLEQIGRLVLHQLARQVGRQQREQRLLDGRVVRRLAAGVHVAVESRACDDGELGKIVGDFLQDWHALNKCCTVTFSTYCRKYMYLRSLSKNALDRN